MSRIPKSFITPNSKIPAPSAGYAMSEPVDRAKKTAPLADIKMNTLMANVRSASKPNVGMKRPAPVAAVGVPQKQVKLAAKPTIANKIPPHDYKARFNDLSEKFKTLKEEHARVKEKYEESSDELESVKNNFENLSEKEKKLSAELADLCDRHERLTDERNEIVAKLDLQKNDNDVLKTDLARATEERSELLNSLDSYKLKLAEIESKLSCKNSEYDTLKIAFEREIKKCLELTSESEGNRIKLMSASSEIDFLKNQRRNDERRIEECDKTISEQNGIIEELKSKNERYEEYNRDIDSKLKSKLDDYQDLKSKYELSVENCNSLSASGVEKDQRIFHYCGQINELNNTKTFLESVKEKQTQEINELKNENADLLQNLQKMFENQKKLRNTIQDLKGHIRVFCRIRPPLASESTKSLLNIDVMDSSTMEVEKSVANMGNGLNKKAKHSFSFDGIFAPNCPQDEVFEEVSGLIQSAMDGYNVCIFAYGQTGSGKTYTMEGDSDNVGIIPRAIDMIFNNLPNLKLLGWEFKITVSFLEIYNENIYDLLNSNKDQDDHSIKMVDSKGEDVYVSNLTEKVVTNVEDLKLLLSLSQKNRQTAATICNERSSRSHSVTKIKFEAHNSARGEKFHSNLNLVDLAGSESAKTSQRMDETKSINKSLLELSKVILALQSKQSHVPYRNSKLTYLLMPSLGGNSKTLMLVNIAQLDDNYQETLNSLRFAAKVNSCKVGVTKKNISTV